MRTVGVMGDYRTYDYLVGLRAVTSSDGMTVDFYPFEMDFIGRVATRIINEVKGVNRVLYDVTSKPPGRSSGNDFAHRGARALRRKRSLPDQRLFQRLSLRDPRLVVAPRGASVLRYLTCSMNARSLGKT